MNMFARLLLCCWAMSGLQAVPQVSEALTPWASAVADRLPAYGHRNWIVVADSAYPAQSKEGIETIVANADQMEVLRGVLAQLTAAKHVTPIIYTDRELAFLDEKDSPGIDEYRQQLAELVKGRGVQSVPHEKLIAKLDDVSKTFRVLIVKTNMTLPYTTVFMQLDCAYWGPEAEKRLRGRMLHEPK